MKTDDHGTHADDHRRNRSVQLSRRGVLRGGLVGSGVLLGSGWLAACGSSDEASCGGGEPRSSGDLAAYNPDAEAGTKSDLPRRIALAMDNDREYAQAVSDGIEAGAQAAGVEFVSANAEGDSAKNIEQIQQFLTIGVGALVINPIDPGAQAAVMNDALARGIAVMSIVTPPATMMANADQFRVGKTLGDAAGDYIQSTLGGQANVVILNQDSVEAVRPRFEAIRQSIQTAGGVIVADIEPQRTDKDAAFETMSTILQKNPDIDVVLGADSVSLGALAALEAEGQARPDMYIGGIDGEQEALDAILQPDSAYKASVAFGTQIFTYPFGLYAADWIEGRSVPQGIEVKAVTLDSAAAIAQYRTDMANPTQTWQNSMRRDRYVGLSGNITWDSCGRYLDYLWTP